jgi:short-subunit dehydrogenase
MVEKKQRTAVITGASSGIGRATAITFAKSGYNLVLAARRQKALQETATECQKEGAEVLTVLTDISSSRDVEGLSTEALKRFGRYDVWVNNAGVYMDGRFLEVPLDAYIRLFEVNLFGTIYGMRVALGQFEKQNDGVLINVSSVFGMVAAPYVSAYCASKFSIRAISQALRAEYRGSGISICTVLPATIDTPLYVHAANYTGRTIKPVPPLYDPSQAARVILSAATHPRDELFVGTAAYLLFLSSRLFPNLTARILARLVEKEQFGDEGVSNNPGNLFQPILSGTGADGGWKGKHS